MPGKTNATTYFNAGATRRPTVPWSEWIETYAVGGTVNMKPTDDMVTLSSGEELGLNSVAVLSKVHFHSFGSAPEALYVEPKFVVNYFTFMEEKANGFVEHHEWEGLQCLRLGEFQTGAITRRGEIAVHQLLCAADWAYKSLGRGESISFGRASLYLLATARSCLFAAIELAPEEANAERFQFLIDIAYYAMRQLFSMQASSQVKRAIEQFASASSGHSDMMELFIVMVLNGDLDVMETIATVVIRRFVNRHLAAVRYHRAADGLLKYIGPIRGAASDEQYERIAHSLKLFDPTEELGLKVLLLIAHWDTTLFVRDQHKGMARRVMPKMAALVKELEAQREFNARVVTFNFIAANTRILAVALDETAIANKLGQTAEMCVPLDTFYPVEPKPAREIPEEKVDKSKLALEKKRERYNMAVRFVRSMAERLEATAQKATEKGAAVPRKKQAREIRDMIARSRRCLRGQSNHDNLDRGFSILEPLLPSNWTAIENMTAKKVVAKADGDDAEAADGAAAADADIETAEVEPRKPLPHFPAFAPAFVEWARTILVSQTTPEIIISRLEE